MIRLLKHHQVDEAKYDLCVTMDAQRLPYGLSWYLNCICDWEVLVLNDYDAVWPLPVKQRFGQRYYYRPFGVQQLGIFSKKPLSQRETQAFVQQMAIHVRYADLYLNEAQLPPPEPYMKMATFKNLVLSLQPSYEKLYQGFNSNTKRNLKKANKQKFEVFLHDSPKVLLELFKQSRGKELKLAENFYINMEKLMFLLLHKNQGKLYSIYGGPNQLLAGAFIVQVGQRHVFLFSALSDMGRELGAMHYLINEYLIYHSGTDVLFDFEGSMDEGLARFYKGFGAEERLYYRLLYNRLPFYMRIFKG